MKVALENLCTLITDGTHYTPPNIGEGFPFLTVVDMQPAGLNFETCSRISSKDFAEADRQNSVPKYGDVLFSKDGTVGKVHVIDGEEPFAVLSSIAIIRPDPEKLDPGYLAHFLKSPEAVSAADRSKTGSALRRIILKDIKRLKLSPPPIPEQRRIVRILDQADEIRRLRRRSLARLSELGEAIFYEMFSCPDGKYETETFGDVAELRRGPFGGALKKEIFVESGYQIYEQSHAIGGNVVRGRYFITPAKFQEMKAFEILPDDLIISCSGTMGQIYLIPNDAPRGIINQALLRVRAKSDKIKPEILEIFLSSGAMKRFLSVFARGSGLKNFPPISDVKEIRVPILNSQVQEAILQMRNELNHRVQKAELALEKSDSLFSSLQHRAFRGEL